MTGLAAGEVLGLTVAPGVEALLRVIGVEGSHRCVVMTPLSGPPRARAPREGQLFAPQPRTHDGWQRPLLGGWVAAELPAGLRSLGVVPVRDDERERVVHPSQWVRTRDRSEAARVLPVLSWAELCRQVEAQWRWEHGGPVRPRSAGADALWAAVASSSPAKKAPVSWDTLRRRRFFAVWGEEVPAEVRAAAEARVHDALPRLEKGGARARTTELTKLKTALLAFQLGPEERDDVEEVLAVLREACAVTRTGRARSRRGP